MHVSNLSTASGSISHSALSHKRSRPLLRDCSLYRQHVSRDEERESSPSACWQLQTHCHTSELFRPTTYALAAVPSSLVRASAWMFGEARSVAAVAQDLEDISSQIWGLPVFRGASLGIPRVSLVQLQWSSLENSNRAYEQSSVAFVCSETCEAHARRDT